MMLNRREKESEITCNPQGRRFSTRNKRLLQLLHDRVANELIFDSLISVLVEEEQFSLAGGGANDTSLQQLYNSDDRDEQDTGNDETCSSNHDQDLENAGSAVKTKMSKLFDRVTQQMAEGEWVISYCLYVHHCNNYHFSLIRNNT